MAYVRYVGFNRLFPNRAALFLFWSPPPRFDPMNTTATAAVATSTGDLLALRTEAPKHLYQCRKCGENASPFVAFGQYSDTTLGRSFLLSPLIRTLIRTDCVCVLVVAADLERYFFPMLMEFYLLSDRDDGKGRGILDVQQVTRVDSCIFIPLQEG